MPERPSKSPRPRRLAHQFTDLPPSAPAEHPGVTGLGGRHRRGSEPQRAKELSPESVSTGWPTGRLQRAGLPAAVSVVGLICLMLLLNPFGPRLVPTTNAAQHDPQIHLGPLPFDTSAPPIPTGQPHSTLESVTTPSASPAVDATKRPTRRPTTRRSSKSSPTPVTDDRTIVQQIGPSHGPITGTDPLVSWSSPASATSTADVPQPPAPTASLSTASLALGASRNGSFSVSISPGAGTWSAEDTSHIDVDADGSFTVDAPRSEAGCPGPSRTTSETVSISWQGSNGTATASGILTLTVSWTTTKDKGDWIHSSNAPGGGYWSNCTPNDVAYPGFH